MFKSAHTSDQLFEEDGSALLPSLTLTAEERDDITIIADGLLSSGGTLESQIDVLATIAHGLPQRLRMAIASHRVTGRPYGGFVVRNLPVDESAVGPTPTEYGTPIDSREADRGSAILLLLGSLLGDPVSYLSQQRGKLVLDLFPIAGHEHDQLGSSSETLLEWHNEDAFHPLRADWIMLLGLRNRDRVPTTCVPVQSLTLDDQLRAELFEEQFAILPDESHTQTFNDSTTGLDVMEGAANPFKRIEEMSSQPERVAILSGDRNAPYIRIDPAFMPLPLQGNGASALSAVVAEVDRKIGEVVLGSGDLLILDNKRAVHGRAPFKARYDGTDRWLRRINVLADLRLAAGRRHAEHGRALA